MLVCFWLVTLEEETCCRPNDHLCCFSCWSTGTHAGTPVLFILMTSHPATFYWYDDGKSGMWEWWISNSDINQWGVTHPEGAPDKNLLWLRWCEGAKDDAGYLLVTSDQPYLISPSDDTGVLVHGNHVSISAELICHAHNLPEQADLVTDRLLGCRPKECPDIQSESSKS